MKKRWRPIHYLKKLSLVQQLIVVLGGVALTLVAIMMPLVDYNLNRIVDNQMYQTLILSQYSIINDSYMPDLKQSKQTYHIIYDSQKNVFIDTNIQSQDTIYELYYYVFGNDLQDVVKNSKKSFHNKGRFSKETYYYQITQYNDTRYLISIVSSEYSADLISSLHNQIIYIQYAFFLVMGAVMVLWVFTLIRPLKKIKQYIDDIKEHKQGVLNIDREDEIGIVSKALVEMKEELDKQENIKEEMIHNISHDLKTPIALIKTYSQSVKDDIYPYGDKNSSMDIILENAERLDHKVKSFLYLNRLDYLQGENVEFSEFDMKHLIEKIVSQMDLLKPEIRLETELDDVLFIGNDEHWRVAVENIIENASRYALSQIKIILHQDYLEIYNDGEHIDEETLPFLFVPYVKGVKGQFGLGLSIVAKIASLYDYHVEAINKDKGVSFIFTKNT